MIVFTDINDYDDMFISEEDRYHYGLYKKSIYGTIFKIGIVTINGDTFFPEGDKYIEYFEMSEIMNIMTDLKNDKVETLYFYSGDKEDFH